MLTADIILQYVRAMQNSMGSNIETLYKIVADKAEALEFRVRGDSPVLGIPLEKLRTRNNLLVAMHQPQRPHYHAPRQGYPGGRGHSHPL